MEDLRDKNIISEYLMYADEHYKECRGNANWYEASESLLRYPKGTPGQEESFLIVDDWDFIREFNSWAEDNYGKELYEETRYELPVEPLDRKYFTEWLDYLTQDMWGFGDEYSVCNCCYQAFRSSPDSYSWTQTYWIDNGEIICEECVRNEYAEEYIESLHNNPKSANTILSDRELRNLGYERFNDYHYEHGWYGTMNDPERIAEEMKRLYPEHDYVFSICNNEQFRTEFDLWVKEAA